MLQIRTVSTCGAFLMALHDILIKRDLRRIQWFITYPGNIWNPTSMDRTAYSNVRIFKNFRNPVKFITEGQRRFQQKENKRI